MRYVQSLPPLVTPPASSNAPQAVAATAAAHPVGEQRELQTVIRTRENLPPSIRRRRAQRAAPGESERRTYCRRIRNETAMQELRSGVDRRRRNQRQDDLTTSIDEKI